MNFATLQGLTIPEGNVTQITDANGRVIWSAVKEVGALTLRPSADISVEHDLNPADSTAAYLLINEESQDGSSTYIESNATTSGGASVSKFKLAVSGQALAKSFVVTSVNIVGSAYSGLYSGTYKNEFRLEINGTETASVTDTSAKSSFDFSVSDAIALINEAVATSGALPDINIIITSYMFKDSPSGSNKEETFRSGVTQVYVVLGYEA